MSGQELPPWANPRVRSDVMGAQGADVLAGSVAAAGELAGQQRRQEVARRDLSSWASPGGTRVSARRVEPSRTAGCRCQIAVSILRVWTVAVGLTLVGDAVYRLVSAFGGPDLDPDSEAGLGVSSGPTAGADDEWCTLGGLSRCVPPALLITTRLCTSVIQLMGACLLVAAEIPMRRCSRCVVLSCGMLASFGGKGLFMILFGAGVAMSGQGYEPAPGGLRLVSLIAGCLSVFTGLIWVVLALPCIEMPPHPTNDLFLLIDILERTHTRGKGRHSAIDNQSPTIADKHARPVAAPGSFFDPGCSDDQPRIPRRGTPPPLGQQNNPFYGNRHITPGGVPSMQSIIV